MKKEEITDLLKKVSEKMRLNRPIKVKLNKDLFKYLLTSLISVVLVFAILGSVTWYNRGKIFEYFAKEYLKAENPSLSDENALDGETPQTIIERKSIFTQESFVIDAVKKTNPAVVSIILTKEVPKYEAYTDPNAQNNPFGDLFPNFFFNIPQYRQNGTEKKEIGGGSGFFVTSGGLIVTNRHVVDQEDVEYTVFTNDGKKYDAKVVARDEVLDIAILKVEGNSFPYLNLGDSDKLEVGQSVIAIGNALAEFKNTVSVGVVSGLSRSITAGDASGKTELLDNIIQTDAAINPGNSGGPLLDLSGKVVGVNVAVAQGSENIGFALPINTVRGVVDSVKATGKIVRPYLGVRYVAVNSQMQEKNNLTVDYGALVKAGQTPDELAVIPGSPADKAGIVENDIILEVNGKKLDDTTSLASLIRDKKVGEVITLKILHRGEQKTVKVTLEALKS